MKLADFDYPLPEDRIAQAPVTPRDASRLLVLRPEGPIEHRVFRELDQLLSPGDLLVLNDTKVIPARLVGRKPTGGKAEILLCEPLAGGLGRSWRAMGQASKGLREGAVVELDGLSVRIVSAEGEGFYEVELDREGEALAAALARAGALPLPPYIRRAPGTEDADRYQTVVARAPGSAAAPTAGLHFTPELLARLAARGVARTSITLHVGPGTFLPVRTEDLAAHRMHGERYEIPSDAAAAFAACRARGGRVVAVGTTSVRTLESAFEAGALRVGEGRTELFIRPGYPFRAVDSLVTNFHLPRSTLLILVCAFGERRRVIQAYSEAIDRGYRFFSYGDAMWLTGPPASRRVV